MDFGWLWVSEETAEIAYGRLDGLNSRSNLEETGEWIEEPQV